MRKWISLLRAFFPSWRFFIAIGPEIRIEARYGPNEQALSQWIQILPPIRRTWRSLFINPDGNFLHACHNSLQHLAREIGDNANVTHETIESLTNYQIARNLSLFQLKKEYAFQWYQFRLSLHFPQQTERPTETILISPAYRAEA